MKLLVLVFAMVLIVEGLPYAAAPEKMREWLLKLSEVPPSTLRVIGLVSLCSGLIICWLVQRSSLFI
ncbi:MAG: DUF2065 domain-containing protein [Desulfocapsaceae bacterium]